jgi:hypothetical protein
LESPKAIVPFRCSGAVGGAWKTLPPFFYYGVAICGSRRQSCMPTVTMAARAFALAGSMFSLLEWWLDHGRKTDPREMDRIFHSMAWQGIQRRPAAGG